MSDRREWDARGQRVDTAELARSGMVRAGRRLIEQREAAKAAGRKLAPLTIRQARAIQAAQEAEIRG